MSTGLILLCLTNNPEGTTTLITLGIPSSPSDPPIASPDGSFLFKRNVNVYISKASSGLADASNTVFLNVKDFSYNKDSRVDLICRNTLDPTQERKVDPYVTEVSPVNFKLTTYIMPIVDTNVTSPEEYLWVSLMGSDVVTSNGTQSTIDFADGNVPELHNLTLWFDDPNRTEGGYRLDNCVIDSAKIKLNINEIAEIEWSGRALSLVGSNGVLPSDFTDRTTEVDYIKIRPSLVSLAISPKSYTLALIGGEINIANNNTFYGRVRTGETKVPTGSYTGNRVVSGNLNFYSRTGTDRSIELFKRVLNAAADNTYETSLDAVIEINLGGTTTSNLQINIPRSILSIPKQDFAEVISMNVPFNAKEGAGNYCNVVYKVP